MKLGFPEILLGFVALIFLALLVRYLSKYPGRYFQWPRWEWGWKTFWNFVSVMLGVGVIVGLIVVGMNIGEYREAERDRPVFEKEFTLDKNGNSEVIDYLNYGISTEYRACLFGSPSRETLITYLDGRSYSFYNNGDIEKGWLPFKFTKGDRGDRIRVVFKKKCP